jgi:hypothetical protein
LCCQSGDLCLNNTLCAFQSGLDYFYRGSCVSLDWSDPECPNFCVNPSEKNDLVPVYPCMGDDQWVCGGKRNPTDDSPSCFELSGALSNLILCPLLGWYADFRFQAVSGCMLRQA